MADNFGGTRDLGNLLFVGPHQSDCIQCLKILSEKYVPSEIYGAFCSVPRRKYLTAGYAKESAKWFIYPSELPAFPAVAT
jgi:hypothetical protein